MLWWTLHKLKSKNELERMKAAEKLGASKNQRAAESLLAAVKDTDIAVRSVVVRALGQIGDARSVESLLEALKDDSASVRISAAESLGKVRDSQVVKHLIAALKDKDSGVCQAAAEALKQVSSPEVEQALAEYHRREKEEKRLAEEARVKRLAEEAEAKREAKIKPLIASLNSYLIIGIDHNVGRRAAETLGEVGDVRAVEPLIAALKNEYVRSAASEALSNISDVRAVEPLIAALKDSDRYVRYVVATKLGRFGDARAVEPLIEALKDSDDFVRKCAAEALGKMGGVRAIEPLTEALKDRIDSVRECAAKSLGEIGDARAVEPLITALKYSTLNVLLEVASALGKIGDVRAFEPLLVVLDEIYHRLDDSKYGKILREGADIEKMALLRVLAKHDGCDDNNTLLAAIDLLALGTGDVRPEAMQYLLSKSSMPATAWKLAYELRGRAVYKDELVEPGSKSITMFEKTPAIDQERAHSALEFIRSYPFDDQSKKEFEERFAYFSRDEKTISKADIDARRKDKTLCIECGKKMTITPPTKYNPYVQLVCNACNISRFEKPEDIH